MHKSVMMPGAAAVCPQYTLLKDLGMICLSLNMTGIIINLSRERPTLGNIMKEV